MTFDQIKSAAIPIGATLGGAAVTFGFMTASQVTDVTTNVHMIWDGAAKVFQGIGGLIVVLGPIWAAYRNSKSALVARVQASPTEQVVTTDPKVAAAVPAVTHVQDVTPGTSVLVPAPQKPV